MKIIDLLNKIANGEEVPKNIYCFNREFYLKGNTYFGDTFTLMHYIQEDDLNDEVEILEEEKKTKPLEEKKIPEKIPLSSYHNSTDDIKEKVLINKINEIIDYLKSKGDE